MPLSLTFTEDCYPLFLPCGRQAWQGAELTPSFAQLPKPGRTYMRHLLADYLRRREATAVRAAELELWASLNAALRFLATDFLKRRQLRISVDRMDLPGRSIAFPLGPLFQDYLQLFPAVPLELGQVDGAGLISHLQDTGQSSEMLMELVLLQVQKQNPALQAHRQLFQEEEEQFQQLNHYRTHLEQLDSSLPVINDGFSERPQTLLARLMEPLQRGKTLREQLQLILDLWSEVLPESLRQRITGAFAQDEAEGVSFGLPAEAETVTLDPASYLDGEYAAFTRDLEWMPRTVLLAKSTYVWLAQLSHKYQRAVNTLDQIPSEELDELVDNGFTGLWLIGIWERSQASLKIKQRCGQLQVAASAYAIADYRIAADLGGEGAFADLRQRCRERGLDLACDVVTNHTGIESTLLREHPDWFIQQPVPPYPGYRFNGPDLSEDPEYAIQIEDGYYDHSEAAVVCRYQHRRSGEVRYIYHGNDGTHLPWNDTVQLNYLLPEVREAMIQLIIAVARRFRIIRFDAAMTLAKKHFQRLWYPLPGGGAGVPSRQDHALSREAFNSYFPQEFWRELVDRVRVEAPDALLIAEAFWLMEGYFVRTLGMHRVYNSAFMNMLKREENAKYRQTLKNVLAFDPAILQRFVNFMSNPDEEPASEQFGGGDKYFCVATLLATMPGLPMFGHGQIEGLREKYGMEYTTPRWQETPDEHLMARHRREIFPLLRQRAWFSGAERFQLYDFISEHGVAEDVFAYSNSRDGQSVLILCNNSPHSIKGRIGSPAPIADQEGIEVHRACRPEGQGEFLLANDLVSGLQYLQPADAWYRGGDFELEGYAHRVMSRFQWLADSDGRWRQLWQRYGRQGRRDYHLLLDALLVKDCWAPADQLLALARPGGSRRRIAALLEDILGIFRQPRMDALSADRILAVLLEESFSDSIVSSAERVELAELLEQAGLPGERPLFRLFDRVTNQRSFRSLLRCHYWENTDWLDRGRLQAFCQLIFLYRLFLVSRTTAESPRDSVDQAVALISQLRKVVRLAGQLNDQVDTLLQRLDGPPSRQRPLAADPQQGRKILFVAAEVTPFAKSGGLADVAGALPRALRKLGHDVQVMLPAYRQTTARGVKLDKVDQSVEITLQGTAYRASLKRAVHGGVPHWFIDTPEFFDREGLYGDADGDYPDNGLRFGFFCRAVLEATRQLGFQPDLIHVNDWQTGLLPVLLRNSYAGDDYFAATATLLTIHNLGYQGMFPLTLQRRLELPAAVTSPQDMEYYGRLSFLKGAINNADLINTVSPSYCLEIQQPQLGLGFDGLLRERRNDLSGILNGLDGDSWNPQADPLLPHAYSAENLAGKGRCKKKLQEQLGLETAADIPLVVVISRLDQQKGIDLVEAIWPQLLERRLQFVLLGSGSRREMAFWQERQGQNPDRVVVRLAFDEELSHRLYAAADLLLIPSRYEPCGLTQMIALKYGVLPVVRRTGGLADTVVDLADEPSAGNGFVFNDAEPQQLLTALDRGLSLYAQRRRWLTVVKRAMLRDCSWDNSARQYQKLYQKLITSSSPKDEPRRQKDS